MPETIYTILLSLRLKLFEDISYARSVVETVGEPCDGFCETLHQSEILLEQVEAHIRFLESDRDALPKKPVRHIPDDIPIFTGIGC